MEEEEEKKEGRKEVELEIKTQRQDIKEKKLRENKKKTRRK